MGRDEYAGLFSPRHAFQASGIWPKVRREIVLELSLNERLNFYERFDIASSLKHVETFSKLKNISNYRRDISRWEDLHRCMSVFLLAGLDS